MKVLRLACLIVLSLAAAGPVFAQTETATVVGVITDAQGGVLPGVHVTARNAATGFTRETVTDTDGRYRLPALPPGVYDFTTQLAGFTTGLRRGVTLTVGSEAVLNFEMKVGGVAEEMTVTAEAPVVETTTAAVQTSLNREMIDLLPLIGRDYTSLLRLAPGAQNSNGTSFTGSRGRSNQWYIDGVDNSEDISGYSRQSPAVDSIQEVQVLVNGFKAEYGSASGGVVNVITRSGTNDMRGSAFFLFRDESMMSRSPYADRSLPKDPFQRIHYGGTIGGPIKRDKLHFFGTYEREDRDTFSSSTFTLPTADQIRGASAATRQFLAANGITAEMFGTGGRQRLVRPDFVNVHKATARLDAQLNASQMLTFRYTTDRERDPSGQGGTLLDFNGSTAMFRTNYGNLNHKWIVSNNKVNEAYLQVGQTYGDWFAAYPSLTNISVSGGFSLGGPTNFPQGRTDNIFQFTDAFTWHLNATRSGDHVIKAGTQIKIFKSSSFFDSNFRGIYTFPSITRFLSGTPTIFTQNQGDTRLKRPNQIYGFYLQDDWRPNTSLTLNLGLRYDYEGAKTEALRDINGAPGPGISGDKNNFSPRFGFAYAPGGSTKQAFYGGTGIYYDQIILNIIGNARFTPPKVIGVRIDNPRFPDPTAGGTLSLPVPAITIIDPELQTGYNWNTQIGYRRELATDLGLDISVVHNRGYDQVAILNTNAGIPGSASIFGTNPNRPDKRYTNINFYSNFGKIRYTGLIAELTKRFSNGMQGSVNYTLSKTEDNAFNFVSGFQVPERMDLNWGPGSQDRRHVLRGNVVATLPFDIQLGVIAEYMSAAPLNITAARDLNGDGITGDWVNEAICLKLPTCGGFTYSRNSVRQLSTADANALRALFGLSPIERFEKNPEYFNADVTLQKRVRFSGVGLRVTAEAFNVFNIPQRNQPSTSITAGTFGSYTSVAQPRAVQLTFQFDF